MLEGENESSDDDKALNNKPRWVRALIFIAGPFMNLAIAFIMVLVLNFYIGYTSCAIAYIADNSPVLEAPAPLAVGDVIVSYAGKHINVPTEVFIYMYDTKGAPASVEFKRGGELLKTTITPSFTAGKRYILGFTTMQASGPDWNIIESVTAGDPAEMLGIQPGDKILTIAGRAPESIEELRSILAESGGGEVDVTWSTSGGTMASGRAAPKLTNDQDNYSIGVAYAPVASPGLLDGIASAYYTSISYSKMVLYSLKWMVTGAIGLGQASGPVGIVADISAGVEEASKQPEGVKVVITYLLSLSALIGINLGLFNLIPFPPLDGSKLLLLGVEAVRRKDIPPERQMAITMFGFVVLIIIMVLTLFNDIFKIINK